MILFPNNCTFVHHYDEVCGIHDKATVSDQNDGRISQGEVQDLLYLLICERVDIGCRLIQDQHAGSCSL